MIKRRNSPAKPSSVTFKVVQIRGGFEEAYQDDANSPTVATFENEDRISHVDNVSSGVDVKVDPLNVLMEEEEVSPTIDTPTVRKGESIIFLASIIQILQDSLSNIATLIHSINESYPLMKHVVITIMTIFVVRKLLEKSSSEDESPPSTIIIKNSDDNFIMRSTFTLIAGCIAAIAGSISFLVYNEECNPEDNDDILSQSKSDEIDRDSCDGKNAIKTNVGVGGAAIVTGFSARKAIISKVLSIWF